MRFIENSRLERSFGKVLTTAVKSLLAIWLAIFRRIRRLAAERADDAAVEQHHDERQRAGQRRKNPEALVQRRAERRVDVIDIGARLENPVPRRIDHFVRDLRHDAARARLGERIRGEAVTLAPDHVDGLPVEVDAVRILELADVLAVHLRLDRVHQDRRVRIEDREIAARPVADLADRLHGALLRIRLGQGARGDALAERRHDGERDLRGVHQVVLAFLQTDFLGSIGVVDRYGGKAHKAQDQRQPELLNKR